MLDQKLLGSDRRRAERKTKGNPESNDQHRLYAVVVETVLFREQWLLGKQTCRDSFTYVWGINSNIVLL